MRHVVALVCSLLLLCGQFAAASAACASAAKATGGGCHCQGKMSCCSSQPAQSPVPVDATRGSIQNQFVSLIPAMETWIFSNAGVPAISPTIFPKPAGAAPIFARHCARLI